VGGVARAGGRGDNQGCHDKKLQAWCPLKYKRIKNVHVKPGPKGLNDYIVVVVNHVSSSLCNRSATRWNLKKLYLQNLSLKSPVSCFIPCWWTRWCNQYKHT